MSVDRPRSSKDEGWLFATIGAAVDDYQAAHDAHWTA